MPNQVTKYSLLISCPGDIKDEIAIIEKCVKQFNALYSDTLGLFIETKHWKKNSYAQSGGKPQALLNEQFVKDCDAAVAIFWTRFGTPTDEYGSGTEEEIEIMLNSGKQVFMYFSDKALSPSKQDQDGYKKVQSFKEKYIDKGVFFSFLTNEEFEKLFFAHISQHFLSQKRVAEINDNRRSQLKLVGIDKENHISDKAVLQPFCPGDEKSCKHYKDRIESLIHSIIDIELQPFNRTVTLALGPLKQPVIVDKDRKGTVAAIARILKIELPDHFFNFGNLTIDRTAGLGPLGYTKYVGDDKEKTKYKMFLALEKQVQELYERANLEKQFTGMQGIKLAITNDGEAIDEDVEIIITAPLRSIQTIEALPELNNQMMSYLLNDCDMDSFFMIHETAQYKDYNQSCRSKDPMYIQPTGLWNYPKDYSEDFLKELEDIFCYSVFEEDDKVILKLKVDYIKHHTTVAFPTMLFISKSLHYLEYTITSKNNGEIVSGKTDVI